MPSLLDDQTYSHLLVQWTRFGVILFVIILWRGAWWHERINHPITQLLDTFCRYTI